MMSINKNLVVSLFCGIGGLDLGFESAGFEIAVAIDNNPKVLELYRMNFPNTLVLCRDIGDISAAEIREVIQNKYPDWDGEIAAVIGGPPCQGFSVAGKQDINDERSQLVLKFINLVVELNPSMFVMENVPAIEWKKFSNITKSAIPLIEEHYILSKWLLTASDYGVPQKRQRAIWVGSKFGELAAPVENEKKFNVGEA
ncbi:C-5 cytosine-specific DNA methylase [Calothrix sp. NIES-2100]|uniref:DNA cytosine methyltransferase n=1 Tax=Calothrix sp. NIES-2100 TaxID=1954172 RepID=UPI000B612EE5|nr:C-5 cytosine-specific DNA methylase [Calothrix sp. NIES-2100]